MNDKKDNFFDVGQIKVFRDCGSGIVIKQN